MPIASQAPASLRQTMSWKTDVLKSFDGSEQRISIVRNPRSSYGVGYLEDSDAGIQFWKYELTFESGGTKWFLPLWGEILPLSAPVTASDTVVNCDFSETDTALGQWGMLLHLNGSSELILGDTSTRTDSTMTLSSGSILNDYPLGSYWLPVESVFVRTDPGYRENVRATAVVSVVFDLQHHKLVEGYGSSALATYLGRPVLDVHPDFIGSNEVFTQRVSRTDYGGKVRVSSGENSSHSGLTRRYRYTENSQRQWWKLFLSTVKGQQGSFYTSTYREDLTLTTQPAQGSTAMVVSDSSRVAGGWENLLGHQDLALTTADGDVQYVRIDLAGTVDNGNGTHTIEFTPALTNTPLGSTVNKISFFELVRLASDEVVFDYLSTHRLVTLSTRTVTA